jgi:hypothetical protein
LVQEGEIDFVNGAYCVLLDTSEDGFARTVAVSEAAGKVDGPLKRRL